MTKKTGMLEIIVPPEETESGDVIREVCIGNICKRQRWVSGKWIPFPELTNAAMWYGRRLSEEELRERGIED